MTPTLAETAIGPTQAWRRRSPRCRWHRPPRPPHPCQRHPCQRQLRRHRCSLHRPSPCRPRLRPPRRTRPRRPIARRSRSANVPDRRAFPGVDRFSPGAFLSRSCLSRSAARSSRPPRISRQRSDRNQIARSAGPRGLVDLSWSLTRRPPITPVRPAGRRGWSLRNRRRPIPGPWSCRTRSTPRVSPLPACRPGPRPGRRPRPG